MENTKNKKWNLAHFCAYLSLVISITILILWCCNVGGFSVVSLDSFVGVIVALLAIVVTLAIAWQIFNSIEIKEKIEELNNLKTMLNEQEKERRNQDYNLKHLIFGSLAEIEITNKYYLYAMNYLMTSLTAAMLLDVPKNIDTLLTRMEFVASNTQETMSNEDINKLQDLDKRIKGSQQYAFIKERYEKTYNEFISKVKGNKNA